MPSLEPTLPQLRVLRHLPLPVPQPFTNPPPVRVRVRPLPRPGERMLVAQLFALQWRPTTVTDNLLPPLVEQHHRPQTLSMQPLVALAQATRTRVGVVVEPPPAQLTVMQVNGEEWAATLRWPCYDCGINGHGHGLHAKSCDYIARSLRPRRACRASASYSCIIICPRSTR